MFVEIDIDIEHFVSTIMHNFRDKGKKYYLMGTIQFNNAVFQAKDMLIQSGYTDIVVPQ